MEFPKTDMKFIVPLDTFDYENKDYILMRYELGVLSKDELCSVHKMLQEHFPNSQIIGLPNNISIENCGKEELFGIYKMLKEELGEHN